MNNGSMEVVIFRGAQMIGSGELLPNGSSMALIPNSPHMEILHFQADTELVEEKMPMKFYLDDEEISEGELYQSGGNVVLCPCCQREVDYIASGDCAQLIVDPNGKLARLKIFSS
jgi:hypothetical protein